MRIVWLLLLGIVSYLVAMVVFFPAEPVVDRIRPQLGTVALENVSGKLYKGTIGTVRSTDDLLPLEFNDVGWTLSPKTLLSGGAGVSFDFNGYGGEGQGLVARRWNGDVNVTDFTFNALAKELEVLLPVPIARFNGELLGDIDQVLLVDNLLARFEGTISWNNALLEAPIPTSLGEVTIEITPDDEKSHTLALTAVGGDVAMDGSMTLTQSGDFSADVLFTPSQNTPAAVLAGLRQLGRADAEGRVRFVRQGNVNRLF